MIYIGDGIKLTVTVRDYDGLLIDPTTLELVVTPPSGSPTTVAKASMENPSTGVFYYIFSAVVAGVHRFSFEAGGNVDKFYVDVFEVNARPA